MKNIPIDYAAFSKIRDSVLSDPHLRDGIGTYNEKKLHLFLKKYFVPDEKYREVPYRGYICDGFDGNTITEIMTSSLHGMGEKLSAFLPDHPVNVVFPLISEKRLNWIDPETGETAVGKKSPRSDGLPLLLAELIYIIDSLDSENLTLTAVVMNADEYRLLNGWGPDRKKHAEKLYRIPSEFISITSFCPCEDMKYLIPDFLPEPFTRADFSRVSRLGGRKLSAAVKVLEKTGMIKDVCPGSKPRLFEKV